jgi:predicted PhzF superfamily epimerase YddE/YHI9
MATYAELQARLAAYLAAEGKALESQEYVVGQGNTARRNRRADLEQIRAGITDVTAQLAIHPDNPASRNVRRVRTLRPMY